MLLVVKAFEAGHSFWVGHPLKAERATLQQSQQIPPGLVRYWQSHPQKASRALETACFPASLQSSPILKGRLDTSRQFSWQGFFRKWFARVFSILERRGREGRRGTQLAWCPRQELNPLFLAWGHEHEAKLALQIA